MIQKEITIGQYEKFENATDYDLGVIDGTKYLTFEEALTCGFPDPYTTVISNMPLKKLFELRRVRLMDTPKRGKK